MATAAADSLGEALHRADQAMYDAERAGGDAVREFLRLAEHP